MRNHFVGLHVDFAGFLVSMLCAIHCAALPLLISLLPLLGLGFLHNHLFETLIIISAFILALYALTKGYRRHHRKPAAFMIVVAGFVLIFLGHALHTHWAEITFTALGGTTVAIAHVVNWILIRQSANCCVH